MIGIAATPDGHIDAGAHTALTLDYARTHTHARALQKQAEEAAKKAMNITPSLHAALMHP